MESFKKVYMYPLYSQTVLDTKNVPIYLFFELKRLGLRNSQILIRGLEEKLHTHMFKWCFHGNNWLDLQCANLPSANGKTHSTFPKVRVSGHRHCLPMQWMWSQRLECEIRDKCTRIANLTYCCSVCLGNLNQDGSFFWCKRHLSGNS